MIKAWSTVILSSFLMAFHPSFAQANPTGVKIYSGYFHEYVNNHSSMWPPKKEVIIYDQQCSIIFKSPIPFSDQTVTVVPPQLTYSVKFNGPLPAGKFTIQIHSNDDQEYSLDPDANTIDDTYLVYLILGTNIDRIELTSKSSDDKYVLDKVEVRNNADF